MAGWYLSRRRLVPDNDPTSEAGLKGLQRFIRSRILPTFIIVLFASAVNAGCRTDISSYVGWEIIYSGRVTGYINENGEKVDAFEGCEYGRVLIVDYSKSITCAEYNYSYGYLPDIVIMSNGFNMEACIADEMFDVRR